MTAPARWWDAAFGALYPSVYAYRDDAAAAREVEFAASALGAQSGERVLDVGCGAGRHARALAARKLRVAGADFSGSLLTEAARAGGGPHYVRADFRALPFRAAFDHVTSFFTSFGYFDDAGNAAQLREMRRVVRRAGTLLLDYLNAPRVRTTLVASSERDAGGLRVREARRIRDGRVEKDVEVCEGGAVRARWTESVRLYSRGELEGMLRTAALEPSAVFGDLSGSEFAESSSERLVVVARAR